jgi:hypothetical protein
MNMYGNLTRQVLNLNDQARLALLTAIVKGVYSAETIIHAASINKLNELVYSIGTVSTFKDAVNGYSDRMSSIMTTTPNQSRARTTVLNYSQLPFIDRLQKSTEVQTQLSSLVHSDDLSFKSFIRIKEKDAAMIMGVKMLVNAYAQVLYSIPGASTKNGQLIALQLMQPSNHELSITLSSELNKVILSFKQMYHALVNHLSWDLKVGIRQLTEKMIHLEATYKAPLNKKMCFLYSLKHFLDTTNVQKFSFIGKTPESIGQLKSLLFTLPEEIDSLLLEDKEVEFLKITPLFTSIQSIIEINAANSTFKNKKLIDFYHSLNIKVKAIVDDEAEAAITPVVNKVVTPIISTTTKALQEKTTQQIAQTEKDKRRHLLMDFDIVFSKLKDNVSKQNCVPGEDFLRELAQVKSQFCDLQIDKPTFVEQCNQLINTAIESDLGKQPIWKELLYGLAFCIASLATIGLANLASYVITGHVRFFAVQETESVTAAKDLQHTILTF